MITGEILLKATTGVGCWVSLLGSCVTVVFWLAPDCQCVLWVRVWTMWWHPCWPTHGVHRVRSVFHPFGSDLYVSVPNVVFRAPGSTWQFTIQKNLDHYNQDPMKPVRLLCRDLQL